MATRLWRRGSRQGRGRERREGGGGARGWEGEERATLPCIGGLGGRKEGRKEERTGPWGRAVQRGLGGACERAGNPGLRWVDGAANGGDALLSLAAPSLASGCERNLFVGGGGAVCAPAARLTNADSEAAEKHINTYFLSVLSAFFVSARSTSACFVWEWGGGRSSPPAALQLPSTPFPHHPSNPAQASGSVLERVVHPNPREIAGGWVLVLRRQKRQAGSRQAQATTVCAAQGGRNPQGREGQGRQGVTLLSEGGAMQTASTRN